MKRRAFMGSTIAGGTLSAVGLSPRSVLANLPRQTVMFQETGKYDILLKGGNIIDPANNINSTNMDVAVAGGKIAAVGRNIPAAE